VCCAWGETGHAEVEVGAEWCAVDVAVDRATARIEDKAAAIAVVTEAAVVGVVAETTGVCTTDDVVLRNDTVVAKWAASGVESEVTVDIVEAVSCIHRKRTANANAADAVVGVSATGVTVCTVTANADLASVINDVSIVTVVVVDTVGSTVIEGEVTSGGR
jgi:hypothetical protein